jgi:hypothetical protein
MKSLPRGSPSQDRDAGSNPAGATTKLVSFKCEGKSQSGLKRGVLIPLDPPLKFVAGLVRLASSLASSSGGPTLCKRDHARFVVGPVVKNGRVEVGTIRPDERMNFVIDGDSVELIEVAQWTVELAF